MGEGPAGADVWGGPDPDLRRSEAHVFVEDLGEPSLSDDDIHHLGRSLRLRDGAVVSVTDGRGGWRLCRWVAGSGGTARVEADSPVRHDRRPDPRIGVAFALTGSATARELVHRLTEVGVDLLVPMTTRHSLGRWQGDKGLRLAEGLGRVAREAAMQSRRTVLAEVSEPRSFSSVAGDWAEVAHRAEPGARALWSLPPGEVRWSILVGPEGGWSAEEREAALPAVGLGPTVLRVETAALVAAAVLCALREALPGASPGTRYSGLSGSESSPSVAG